MKAPDFFTRASDQVFEIAAGRVSVVDEERGVLVGDARAPLLEPFQPGLVQQLAGVEARRILEHAAGRGGGASSPRVGAGA